MATERYLSKAEVAERFGVARRTVQRWIAEHQLPAIRIGGVLRISEADLRAFALQAKAGKFVSTSDHQ